MGYGNDENYVSIVGTHWLFPLGQLWTALAGLGYKAPNEVQASPRENGLAVAIVAINAALIESFVVRTKYCKMNRKQISENAAADHPTEFYAKHFRPEWVGLKDALSELFVTRDIIMHNHLYTSEVSSANPLVHLSSPERKLGYDTRRWKQYVSPETRQTINEGFNVFPPRVWTADAAKATIIAYDVLTSMERVDRRFCYISHQYLHVFGKYVRYSEFAKMCPFAKFRDAIAELSPD